MLSMEISKQENKDAKKGCPRGQEKGSHTQIHQNARMIKTGIHLKESYLNADREKSEENPRFRE